MSDIIVEVNAENNALTLIKGDARIRLELDELNEIRRKINFMDYREDVFMILTEEDQIEGYFDPDVFDTKRIMSEVLSGENDEAVSNILSYYGDLREEHNTGNPEEMLDWVDCMNMAVEQSIGDGDFNSYLKPGKSLADKREGDVPDYLEQQDFAHDDDFSNLDGDMGMGL